MMSFREKWDVEMLYINTVSFNITTPNSTEMVVETTNFLNYHLKSSYMNLVNEKSGDEVLLPTSRKVCIDKLAFIWHLFLVLYVCIGYTLMHICKREVMKIFLRFQKLYS